MNARSSSKSKSKATAVTQTMPKAMTAPKIKYIDLDGGKVRITRNSPGSREPYSMYTRKVDKFGNNYYEKDSDSYYGASVLAAMGKVLFAERTAQEIEGQ